MESASPPAVSRKRRQKASTHSKESTHIVRPRLPCKLKTRRARTAYKTDNFNMRISKRNIPKSSRVLRSATQTHHVAESLSESQSCPHSYLADHHDPLTDPLHFEIGGDVSSSEESSTGRQTESNCLLKKCGDHQDIYKDPPEVRFIKCVPDLKKLSMENNNLITQPNKNVIADVQQRGSRNELIVEPYQRAPDNPAVYRTDNLTSVSTAINPGTQSQGDCSQETDLDHLLSDGSSFFEDYRWLLGFDTNDLAPELPAISIDDIATLPNIDLDESVPLTQIRPSFAFSVLTAGPTSSQVSDSTTAQMMMSQHPPSCVSTATNSSPLYLSKYFQTVPQSRSFDSTVKNSVALPYSATSGGTIERISSPVTTNQSVLTNTPSSPYIKQEFDFEPQCRIHLVDTPPSFTRISEPDAIPIRHQVFEWQNSVHSVGHSIRNFQDRQRESFARPKSTSGAQVNERQNCVHPDEPPIRPDEINSACYQEEIFQRDREFMPTPLSGAGTYRPRTSECQDLVYSEEQERQWFTRPQPPSGAQPNERQGTMKEQPFMLTPLVTPTPYRTRSNFEEPSMRTIQSRRHQSVERPQSSSGAQANEPQNSVYSIEQLRRNFKPQWPTGVQASERPISVHSEGSAMKSLRRPQRTSRAPPNERQSSKHLDELPMTTFQGRQEHLLASPQRASRPQANDTLRRDLPFMSTPLPCTTPYNPQQHWAHSGSPVGRIYPRPFSMIPSASQVFERQNWHNSYQPQCETYHSWQDNLSSSTLPPLPQNLTSSEQYQHSRRTMRKRSRQTCARMEASSQQYGSATVDADSHQYSRPHPVSGTNYMRNTPSSSGARNGIVNPEHIWGSSDEQKDSNLFTRSEVNSMMGMHAEHGQNRFPPMLPSRSLYINTPQGSVDYSLPDERAHFISLNLSSKYPY